MDFGYGSRILQSIFKLDHRHNGTKVNIKFFLLIHAYNWDFYFQDFIFPISKISMYQQIMLN